MSVKRSTYFKSILLSVGLGTCFAGLPLTSVAQEGDALEEIVVTAQRREQNILDVPISTAVYGAAQIESSNWRGSRDFINLTPNVSFSEVDSQGTKNGDIAIRGISDLTSGGNERVIQTRAAVGFFVDDFSVGSVASGSANPPLNDVERIEILRGPQGTYFGRNATGGAINVVSKKPVDAREGKVSVGIGNYGTYHAGALVNFPLAENLYARIGIAHDESDGFLDNLSPSGNDPDYKNLNIRGALRWENEDWTVDVTAQTIQENEGNLGRMHFMGLGGTPPVFFPTGIGSPANFDNAVDTAVHCGLGNNLFFENGNEDKMCENADTFTRVDNDIITLRADYAGENYTFTSITGRIASDFSQFEDLDNTGFDNFNRLNEYTSTSISQEFRLSGSAGDSINWTGGVYFYDDEYVVNNRIIAGRNAAPAFVGFLTVPGDYPNENNQNVERSGSAVFGDVEWSINDTMTLNFGGRFSDDEDKQFWTNTYATFDCGTRAVVAGVPDPFLQGCSLRPDQLEPLPIYDDGDGNQFVSGGRFEQNVFASSSVSDTTFTPRVALNWRPNDDQSVFLTWSQGYRPSGTRVAPDEVGRTAVLGIDDFADNRSIFRQEDVTNIELGYKGYFMDRRVKVEASIFDISWDDMQVRISRTLCRLPNGTLVEADSPEAIAAGGSCAGPLPSNRVENADSASSTGAEISVQALLSEGFTVTFAAGTMDAKFDSFTNSEDGDLSGADLPNAPDFTAAASGQYDWDIGPGNAFVRLEATHRSGVATRLGDVTATTFPQITDDFTLFNLYAGYSWENQSLNLAVNNLFEEDYIVGIESFAPSAVALTHPTFVMLRWTSDFSL